MKYVIFSGFKQEQSLVSITARSYPSQCFAVCFTILIQVTVLRAAVTFVNQNRYCVSGVTTCNNNYSCVCETLLWSRQPKIVDPLLQGIVVGLLTVCHSRITVEVTTQKRTVCGSCGCSLHLQEKR